MIKILFHFLPGQDILLGLSLDHGEFSNDKFEKKPFNRLKIGLAFVTIDIFYFI